eukprot:ANDGO_05768.mRNA.1 Cyclin pch1
MVEVGESCLPDFHMSEDAAFVSTCQRRAGVSEPLELALRSRCVEWIGTLRSQLDLSQLVASTAAAYLHRYLVSQSITDPELPMVTATCLFLAAKVEETPRKLPDFAAVVYRWSKANYRSVTAPTTVPEDEFRAIREKILRLELRLLAAISFELTVEKPYRHIVALWKKHAVRDRDLCQYAWNTINDSWTTNICLVYSPLEIALACMRIAIRKFPDCGLGLEWIAAELPTTSTSDTGASSDPHTDAAANANTNTNTNAGKLEKIEKIANRIEFCIASVRSTVEAGGIDALPILSNASASARV